MEKFDYSQVDPAYLRQEVEYLGQEEPGTVVVDPASRHLFFIDAPGKATRYGVGCGSRGFRLVGNREDQHAAQLARLGAAEGNGCP